MHEFKEEGVGHTKRMEERLAIQLAELHRLLVTVESETAPLIERKEAEAAFTALRVKVGQQKHIIRMNIRNIRETCWLVLVLWK
jgi:hypothetical protein